MNKFNLPLRNLNKDRRSRRAHLRRFRSGNPSLKLSNRPHPPPSLSGKRKHKLLKNWRRAQKEALESGLVTMQDIEMISADSTDDTQRRPQPNDKEIHHRFHITKRARLKLKWSKKTGKQTAASTSAVEEGVPMIQ